MLRGRKKGEFNTHGSGESLKRAALKEGAECRHVPFPSTEIYESFRRLTREQDTSVMHVSRVRTTVQLLSTRDEWQQTSGLPDGKQCARGAGP